MNTETRTPLDLARISITFDLTEDDGFEYSDRSPDHAVNPIFVPDISLGRADDAQLVIDNLDLRDESPRDNELLIVSISLFVLSERDSPVSLSVSFDAIAGGPHGQPIGFAEFEIDVPWDATVCPLGQITETVILQELRASQVRLTNSLSASVANDTYLARASNNLKRVLRHPSLNVASSVAHLTVLALREFVAHTTVLTSATGSGASESRR